MMQTKSSGGTKVKVLLAVLLLGAMASESALAQHRRFYGPRVGFYVGAPLLAYSLYRPYYYAPYYYPPYYYPPVAVAPPATYVEQPQQAPFYPQTQAPQYQHESPQAGPQPGNMWYFCNESKAYYPYVKTCPAGWQQVTPQPQG
jgi:hypothetical protein